MSDANDDLGTYVKPFRVVACLAVHGRLPLLEQTITRLYKKNGCYKVICSGDGIEERQLCESLGAVWVHARNKPLGHKWNQSFFKAKDFTPDAVVFVGSSDWLSDNWFSIMRPHVDKHGFAGVPGCDLVDLGETIRGCHWSGYKGYREERADETIGIGRMLSARLLHTIGWLPFNPIFDNSLDRSMKDKAAEFGFTDFMVRDERLNALSLSTHKWAPMHQNKHKFEMHYNQLIPSKIMDNPIQWCEQHFPEAINLHKTLIHAS
jgi:hypothetical protein